jgi:hypothetical protein
MWSELVEMVEKRCLADQIPRQRQARAAILLFGSIINCEEAFTGYKHTHSDTDLAQAVFAIDSFISALHNLDGLLSLFDSNRKEQLERYVLEESREAYTSNPKERLKTQIELLRQTVNAEAEAINLPPKDLDAFTGAREKLAHFIARTFSWEEVLK